jgi:hypothetical protein
MHNYYPGYIIGLLIALMSFPVIAQNAPVSFGGTTESTGIEASVSVTVTGFTNIGSCNLQLTYDPEFVACLNVSKGALLPGNLATNLSEAGVITIGWYTWPGADLPDGTEIFILNFTRIAPGTSAILWDENYTDRQWSDGNSYTLNDLPFESFYFSGSVTFQDDAPVTSAPNLETCVGLSIDLPVTVTNFNTIGALSLTLHFNADAMSYQSFTNNSEFPGLTAFSPGTGIITVAGFSSSSGITFPDNTILFTLSFSDVEESAELFWYDDGVSCEYAGPPPSYPVLNDVPQESFYTDGWVTALSPPEIILQPVSPEPVIELAGTAIFSTEASGAGLFYQWEEFTDSWNILSNGGVYAGCLTSNLTITDPPLSMNGNKYRCIVAGSCEPPAVTDGNATLTVIESTSIKEWDEKEYVDLKVLINCSPNPFKDETKITFTLPFSGFLKAEIIDASGKEKHVLENGFTASGNHAFHLNGIPFSPGIYFIRFQLNSGNKKITGLEKLILYE